MKNIKVTIPDIPNKPGVYIFYFVKNRIRKPFYVGQSEKSLRRRIGEYFVAAFAAPTDFRVGEAIKYLQSKKFDVVVEYKLFEDTRTEEVRIIREFYEKSLVLLNATIDNGGYNYRTADRDEERQRVYQFIDEVLLK